MEKKFAKNWLTLQVMCIELTRHSPARFSSNCMQQYAKLTKQNPGSGNMGHDTINVIDKTDLIESIDIIIYVKN